MYERIKRRFPQWISEINNQFKAQKVRPLSKEEVDQLKQHMYRVIKNYDAANTFLRLSDMLTLELMDKAYQIHPDMEYLEANPILAAQRILLGCSNKN